MTEIYLAKNHLLRSRYSTSQYWKNRRRRVLPVPIKRWQMEIRQRFRKYEPQAAGCPA